MNAPYSPHPLTQVQRRDFAIAWAHRFGWKRIDYENNVFVEWHAQPGVYHKYWSEESLPRITMAGQEHVRVSENTPDSLARIMFSAHGHEAAIRYMLAKGYRCEMKTYTDELFYYHFWKPGAKFKQADWIDEYNTQRMFSSMADGCLYEADVACRTHNEK